MTRKYLTKKERAQMYLDQRGLCACGCGRKLEALTIAEHSIPVAMGNDQKPDSIWRADCASVKTKQDVKDISKMKRRRGDHGQQARRKKRKTEGKKPLLTGPDFNAKLTRGFDGKIKRRRQP